MHQNAVCSKIFGGICFDAPNYILKFPQKQTLPLEQRIGKLITQKINEKQFFYGIELTPTNLEDTESIVYDFRSFADFLPLFTSVVWITKLNWQLEPMECINAIILCKKLARRIPCASHFSAYRVSANRLNDFLNLEQTNIFALRGDTVDPKQKYLYASEMVAEIRHLRGDKISIAVAGYPNIHHEMKTREQDIQNLLKKVNAGSDYIITQICYSSQDLIKFVKSCRAAGIKIPIIIGIAIPHSLAMIKRIETIAHVRLSDHELAAVSALDKQKMVEYFIKKYVRIISKVLAAKVGIYGFHFFAMNRLENVLSVLKRLRKNGVI